eukprot:scaffold109_cov252-Pinguiococcus_pyrenoidosus.AAC.87
MAQPPPAVPLQQQPEDAALGDVQLEESGGAQRLQQPAAIADPRIHWRVPCTADAVSGLPAAAEDATKCECEADLGKEVPLVANQRTTGPVLLRVSLGASREWIWPSAAARRHF